jgi:hypothetical protein
MTVPTATRCRLLAALFRRGAMSGAVQMRTKNDHFQSLGRSSAGSFFSSSRGELPRAAPTARTGCRPRSGHDVRKVRAMCWHTIGFQIRQFLQCNRWIGMPKHRASTRGSTPFAAGEISEGDAAHMAGPAQRPQFVSVIGLACRGTRSIPRAQMRLHL